MKRLIYVVVIYLCLITVNVFAIEAEDKINIDDLVSKFNSSLDKNESDGGSTINIGLGVRLENDSVNKKLNFKSKDDNSVVLAFSYDDNDIYYQNDLVLTDENVNELLMAEILKVILVKSFLNTTIQEVSKKDLYLSDDFTADEAFYDTYGVMFKLGDQSSEYTKGLDSFKLLLSKSKINKLAEDYGKTTEQLEDAEYSQFSGYSATLAASDITANSVNIAPKIVNYDGDDAVCGIYVLDNATNTYKLATNVRPSCSGYVSITIDNLEPSSTYYFKTRVIGSEIMSDAIEVKTLANEITTDVKDTQTGVSDNESKNPKTGIKDTFLILGIIGVLSLIGYFGSKDKSYLKQI